MIKTIKIALMLGGNVGNVPETFAHALKELAAGGVENIEVSEIFRNPAVDCVPGTPDFCNAAVIGSWSRSAAELLTLTQQLEMISGRPSTHRSDESRTLDIDIILFGDRIIRGEKLHIPHPRAAGRYFVLLPLSQIAADWVFPDSGQSVAALLQRYDAEKEVTACGDKK